MMYYPKLTVYTVRIRLSLSKEKHTHGIYGVYSGRCSHFNADIKCSCVCADLLALGKSRISPCFVTELHLIKY